MEFSVAMTTSNIMDAQLQGGWGRGCHPPERFCQSAVHRCDSALSVVLMFDVLKHLSCNISLAIRLFVLTYFVGSLVDPSWQGLSYAVPCSFDQAYVLIRCAQKNVNYFTLKFPLYK